VLDRDVLAVVHDHEALPVLLPDEVADVGDTPRPVDGASAGEGDRLEIRKVEGLLHIPICHVRVGLEATSQRKNLSVPSMRSNAGQAGSVDAALEKNVLFSTVRESPG
jgi:hypothetical protein